MVKLPAFLCAIAMLGAPISAFAADGVAPVALEIKRNATLVDGDGKTLGKIYEVDHGQGVVTFMAQMKVFQVPISTLSSDGPKIRTTLTRAQLGL